jgi:hypothetical protein
MLSLAEEDTFFPPFKGGIEGELKITKSLPQT